MLKFFNTIAIVVIKTVRPLLGPAVCKFEPSCGKFAVQQLQEHNFFYAWWLICKRLLLCSPCTGY